MKRKYSRCECPDEEIYLSEGDGYYNLYLKSPYYEENCFLEEPPEASCAEYEAVKDKLPKPYWAGHEEEIKAHDFAWDLAFRHIGQPTKENGFVRSFIETSFNMSTFMGDSSAMMEFTKYAEEVFDFRGTLDNFYSKQHLDGFICREIRADNGKDRFHRFDPVSVGPYWLGYTEWDLYCRNRDKKRLGKVFAPLMGLHLWIGRHRRNPDGSYWHTGLSTMDNQPRVPDGYSLRLDKAGMSWLGTFFVHKEEYGIVSGCLLEDDRHDLKQSLAQSGGAAFGDISGLRIEVAGLKRRSVNACKSDESFFIGEAGHVADFGNKLRPEDGADAV